ncbi:hypothetical protein E4T80_02170 [Muribacter muris]|uniref:Sel1 repeat family protein n=1 Tax=Muribacter muris TaxID=67855 RepID=A0A4Y9K4Q1_9PAST|nr:hypothetical protein [Muribacter muris]MBF0784284.1 hypothetical protein [Muribacter muris]MBF0826978.1 hypothetical protein [Muribacter muris]TFV13023.1 hypothetical protein E4T80_02170 [Muribacter muris]
MYKKKIVYFLFFIFTISGIAYFMLNIKLDTKNKKSIQNKIITYPVEKLIEQNDIEALELLAKEGNPKAISYLEKQAKAKKQRETEQLFETASLMFNKGEIQTSMTYLRMAAHNGHFQARFMLANTSFIGIDGQDFYTAKQQYEILAASINPYTYDSHAVLSLIYFNGLGTKVDIKKSKYHLNTLLEYSKKNNFLDIYNNAFFTFDRYQALSNMGNKNAEKLMKELKVPIIDTVDIENKIYLKKEWSEKEAKNNNPIALYNLAMISGLELKYDQAVDYAEQAIKYHLPLQYKQSLLKIFRDYAKIGNKKSREFAMKLSQNILDNK